MGPGGTPKVPTVSFKTKQPSTGEEVVGYPASYPRVGGVGSQPGTLSALSARFGITTVVSRKTR